MVSELQNFLIGINVFDRDIARAADLLGFDKLNTERFRTLSPGEFFAFGPALCTNPKLVKIDQAATPHLGFTPDLVEAADLDCEEAEQLLDLGALRETGEAPRDRRLVMKGRGVVDAFLLDPHAVAATQVVSALRQIAPSATTCSDLSNHLALDGETVDNALDLLVALGAVEAMPRGEGRIARLHTRLRQRLSDIKVVGLS